MQAINTAVETLITSQLSKDFYRTLTFNYYTQTLRCDLGMTTSFTTSQFTFDSLGLFDSASQSAASAELTINSGTWKAATGTHWDTGAMPLFAWISSAVISAFPASFYAELEIYPKYSATSYPVINGGVGVAFGNTATASDTYVWGLAGKFHTHSRFQNWVKFYNVLLTASVTYRTADLIENAGKLYDWQWSANYLYKWKIMYCLWGTSYCSIYCNNVLVALFDPGTVTKFGFCVLNRYDDINSATWLANKKPNLYGISRFKFIKIV